jgi:soluble P-type ATPase
MIEVEIPGRRTYQFTHAFFDFNGTLAVDGIIPEQVKRLLAKLADSLELVLLTADTNHSARNQCGDLPIAVNVLEQSGQKQQKAMILQQTAGQGKIAIGNGSLDEDMFLEADLAICIMGEEGCSLSAMLASDILVRTPEDAIELLLHPNRLISTWRT